MLSRDQKIKIVLLAAFGLCLGSSVLAALETPASPTGFMQQKYPDWFNLGQCATGDKQLTCLVALIFKAFLVVAGIIALIMIMVGGFRYLTSVGSPSIMTDSRNQIFSALLGLVLLLSSYLILNTINPELVALQEPLTTTLTPPTGETVAFGQIVVKIEQPTITPSTIMLMMNTGIDTVTLSAPLVLKIDTDMKRVWIEGATEKWAEDISTNGVSLDQDFTVGTNKIHVKLTINKSEQEIAGPSIEFKEPFTYGPKQISTVSWEYKKGPLECSIKNSVLLCNVVIGVASYEKEVVKKTLTQGDNIIDTKWKYPAWFGNVVSQIPGIGDFLGKYISDSEVPINIIIKIPVSPYKAELYAKKDWNDIAARMKENADLEVKDFGDDLSIRSFAIKTDYALSFFSRAAADRTGENKWLKICFTTAYRDLEKCKSRAGSDWGGDGWGTQEKNISGSWGSKAIRSIQLIKATDCANERETFTCNKDGCQPLWNTEKDTQCPPLKATDAPPAIQ